MRERARVGLVGGVVGATLGATRRGATGFVRVTGYDPLPRRMASSAALDSWLVSLRHLNLGHGPETVAAGLARRWRSLDSESAYGAANSALGLDGGWANPLAEGSESLGRAILWGLVFPDDPARALGYAAADSRYDHGDEAVRASAAVAVMASAAAQGRGVSLLLEAAAPVMAGSGRLAAVFEAAQVGSDPARHRQGLEAAAVTADPESAVLGFGYVVSALVAGGGDFGACLRTVVGHGGPCHQTGLVVGVLAGLLAGAVPEEWAAPLGQDYVASHALREIDPPHTLDDFAEALGAVVAAPPSTPTPVEIPSEVGDQQPSDTEALPPAEVPLADGSHREVGTAPTLAPEAPSPPEVTVPRVSDGEVAACLARPPGVAWEAAGLKVRTEALDGWTLVPGRLARLGLHFEAGETQVAQNLGLSVPDGWESGIRPGAVTLGPGERGTAAIVLNPAAQEGSRSGAVRITVGEEARTLPLAMAEEWLVIGPLPDDDGSSFDRTYAAESKVELGAVFNGRSGLAAKWERAWLPPRVLDVEPYFQSGPGVVLLACSMRLPGPGSYRLLVACSPGVVATVDGRRILGYRDTHVPVPRSRPPYVGDFESDGAGLLVLKLLRDREPVAPVVVTLFDSSGAVIPFQAP